MLPRKSGLIFVREVGFSTWEVIGKQLLSVSESTAWWIADWLAYGEVIFQDRYREAARRTSLDYQTLRNYSWVARRFEFARRHDSLSFGHHAEVAALGPPEQDYWLRKAEELNWSRNRLRSEVRNSLRERREAESDDEKKGEGHDGDRPASALPAALGERAYADGATSRKLVNRDEIRALTLLLTSRQFAEFATAAHLQGKEIEEWALQALKMAVDSDSLPSAKPSPIHQKCMSRTRFMASRQTAG